MDLTLALNRSSLLVTLSTYKGNARRRNSRARVFHLEDIMRSMAVLAARREPISTRHCLSV
ncbi:MAG: hypothetical protein AABZ61_01435 [Bacteroidota bacterium]